MATLTLTIPTPRELLAAVRFRLARLPRVPPHPSAAEIRDHWDRLVALHRIGAVVIPASPEAACGAQPAPPPPAPPPVFNLTAFLSALGPLWDDIKHESIHSVVSDPKKIARIGMEVVFAGMAGSQAAAPAAPAASSGQTVTTTTTAVTPTQVLGG